MDLETNDSPINANTRDLMEAANTPVGTYSGGMRRKLDLAASLIVAPRVLFVDEPTTGLDQASRREVWNAISELVRGGTTVLLTTMQQKHSRPTPAGRAVWLTERLWRLARDLPVQTVTVADVPELDQNCWFGTSYVPSCRAVAQHAQRIWDADLSYPIILSADGGLRSVR